MRSFTLVPLAPSRADGNATILSELLFIAKRVRFVNPLCARSHLVPNSPDQDNNFPPRGLPRGRVQSQEATGQGLCRERLLPILGYERCGQEIGIPRSPQETVAQVFEAFL